MLQNLDMLFEGICTLTFEFDDGSRVCSLVSLNPTTLSMFGITTDTLMDLVSMREIPDEILEHLVSVQPGNTIDENLTKLDKFFSAGGKVWW